MRLSRPRHAAWKGRPSAACGGRARVPGRSPRSSSWTLDSGTRSGSPTNETAGRYSPGSLLLSLLRRHRSPEPGTLPGPGAARVTRTRCWVLAARCRVPWVPARSSKTDAFPAPCARRAQGLPRADERDAFSRSCLRFSFVTRENKNDDYFSQFCSRIESE